MVDTPPRTIAASSSSKLIKFSPEAIKKATEAAAVPSNPTAVFSVTPPLDGGAVIIGVMFLFEKYAPSSSSNKQFWGAKAAVLMAIFQAFSEVVPGFAGLADLHSTMQSVEILSNQYSTNQEQKVHRKGSTNGQKYYETAVGFVIDTRGKLPKASDLLQTYSKMIPEVFRREEIKGLYQQIIESTMANFAAIVGNDQNFYKIFSSFSSSIDENPLNKRLPDDDIIKLVSKVTGESNPHAWTEEMRMACWRGGRVPSK